MNSFRKLSIKENAYLLNELQALLEKLADDNHFQSNLILSALKDHDPEVRCYAARKLGLSGLGHQNIVDGLVKALSDEVTPVRQYASAALGALDPLPVSALPAIKQAMEDPDFAVRKFSADNLKLIEKYIGVKAVAC